MLSYWQVRNILSNQGGMYIGKIRTWIQGHYNNGSNVIWGSDDHCKPDKHFTVRDLEGLATDIATAALIERFTHDEQRAIHNVTKMLKFLDKDPVKNKAAIKHATDLLELFSNGAYGELSKEQGSKIQIDVWTMEIENKDEEK